MSKPHGREVFLALLGFGSIDPKQQVAKSIKENQDKGGYDI
jgi:hypothetical protein